MTIANQRDALHQVIEKLPDKLVIEVVTFVKSLQFREHEGGTAENAQEASIDLDLAHLFADNEIPPFQPVHFPAGIVTDFDFSPEYIKEARKKIWGDIGDSLNASVRE